MRVMIGEDVYALAPHLLDQLCQFHGFVLDPFHRWLVAARKLNQGHRSFTYLKLGLDCSGTQRDYSLIFVDWPIWEH